MSPQLDAIFLRVAPPDIALIKFVFESYEGVAIVRTLDRHAAVIMVLVSRDFVDVARGILDCLHRTVAFEEVPAPDCADEDWLYRLLRDG